MARREPARPHRFPARVKETPLKACNTRQLHFKQVLSKQEISFIEWMNGHDHHLAGRAFVPLMEIAGEFFDVEDARKFTSRYRQTDNRFIYDMTKGETLETDSKGTDNLVAPLNALFKQIKARGIFAFLDRLQKLGIGLFITPADDKETSKLRKQFLRHQARIYYGMYTMKLKRVNYFTSGFVLNGEHPDAVITCGWCKKRVGSNRAFKVEGKDICMGCLEGYAMCHGCNKTCKAIELKKDPRKGHSDQFCMECYYRTFARCGNCGNYYLKEKGDKVQGDIVCPSCYENAYTCDGCDERVWEVDDDGYCDSCSHDSEFTCEICGEEYESDGMSEHDDVCEKCACLIDMETRAKGLVLSKDEALSTVPRLKERIDEMFDTSAYMRSINLKRVKRYLASKFPELSFNFKDLTFKTMEGREFKISYILRDRSWVTRGLPESDVHELNLEIPRLYNTREYLVKQSKEIRDFVMEWLPVAIKARMVNEKKNPDAKAATDAITGMYNIGDAKIMLSKDPVDLLSKTTSTCWEALSCEKLYEGMWGMGAFSEIENMGVVAFVVTKEGLRTGRIMLRWCRDSSRKVFIGIEARWYACIADPDDHDNFDTLGNAFRNNYDWHFVGTSVTSVQAFNLIKKVIKDAGFNVVGYNNCKTPYKHGGYSDTTGKGRSSVTFND